MSETQIPYAVPQMLRNDMDLYEGDLVYYGQVIFHYAQNLCHPYHNFRHMLHVMWLCHEACKFYRNELSRRQMRDLLIAALFHDFNHSGMLGDDDLNILSEILRAYGVEEYADVFLLVQGWYDD